jgi:hypothetical protein
MTTMASVLALSRAAGLGLLTMTPMLVIAAVLTWAWSRSRR